MKCFESALSLQESCAKDINRLDGLREILPQILRYGHFWVRSVAIRLIKLDSIRETIHLFSTDSGLNHKWALVDGVIMHLEQQTKTETTVNSVEIENTVDCLSFITNSLLEAYNSTQDHLEKFFIRIRKVAVSAHDMFATAILKWLAKLICVKHADQAANDLLYFHSSLICHVCLKREDYAKQQPNATIAKGILSAISEIVPSESFAEILKKVKAHEAWTGTKRVSATI